MSRIWTGWRLRLPSRQPLEIDPSKETMLNAPLTGKRILVTQSQDFMGPALCRLLAAQGADVLGGSPADYAAFIRAENQRWGDLIRRLGIKAE